jgi:hypothetical protein
VWRENPRVRQRLGFATAPEASVDRGNFQFFMLGYLVSDGKTIYAFPSSGDANIGMADKIGYDWRTFPDAGAR